MKTLILISLITLSVIGLSTLVPRVHSSNVKFENLRTEKTFVYPYETEVAANIFVEQVGDNL